MQTRILLIRHGQSQWNKDSEEDRFNGRTDISLTEYGETQAERIGLFLRNQEIEMIYCSPLRRANNTAGIIGKKLGIVPHILNELIEIDFGLWEGLSLSEIENKYQQLFLDWVNDPAGVKVPGGESGYDVAARILECFFMLEKKHSGNTIAVIAHKVVNRIALCHWLGLPIASFRKLVPQRVGAISSIRIENNTAVWVDYLDDLSYMLVEN